MSVERKNIDFISFKKIAILLSLLLISATIFLLVTKGFNWGIDFTGGVLVELRPQQQTDVAQFRDILSGLKGLSLQTVGEYNDIMIRVQADEQISQLQVIEQIKTAIANANIAVDYRSVSYVGPQVGAELIEAGIMSIILGIGAILIYIWIRFEWQYGIGAITALAHDVIIVAGFYALSGVEFNLTSVAALLTVVGYSINDSVVIYDRVRENISRFKDDNLIDIYNRSINETLPRTLRTSITTLLAVGALLLFGGDVLKSFSWGMFIGVIVGTYSSIYVAVIMLIYAGLKHESEHEEEVKYQV